LATILLINPNSSAPITRSMDACIADLKAHTRHQLESIELAKSPPGIETDDHVTAAIPNILEAIAARPALLDLRGMAAPSLAPPPHIREAVHARTRAVRSRRMSLRRSSLPMRPFGHVSAGIERGRRQVGQSDFLSTAPPGQAREPIGQIA
jgi:hypothetical protein